MADAGIKVDGADPELEGLKKALPGVDIDAFLKRVMGEKEIMFAVFGDIYEEEAGTPLKLLRALAAGDGEGMRQEAHRLKGMAANISAEKLRAAASALEAAAKSGEGDPPRLLHEVQLELYPLLAALEKLRQRR